MEPSSFFIYAGGGRPVGARPPFRVLTTSQADFPHMGPAKPSLRSSHLLVIHVDFALLTWIWAMRRDSRIPLARSPPVTRYSDVLVL